MGLRGELKNDLTGLNFNMNLSEIEPWASYYADHTDLPRMREGRVGGQVFQTVILAYDKMQGIVFKLL
jgi:hypothetical protein